MMTPPRVLPLVFLAAASCSAPFPAAPPIPQASPAEDPVTNSGERPAPGVDPATPLTLDDCIRVALERNRGVRIADRRILIARDRVDETLTALAPKMGITGRYEHRSNRYGMNLGDYAIATEQRDTITASASLIVPLYDFDRTRYRSEADLRRAEAAELVAQQSRQDITLAVSQAYYRVLEARSIKAVVDESYAVVAQQLRIAQDFYKEGLTAKNDMLIVAVQLAFRYQEQIQADNNVRLAESTLARVMGLEATRALRVADVQETAPWRGSLDSVLRLAAERRPDLKALRRQIDAARADREATALDWTPRIEGFGTYNYTADRLILNNDWLSAGVNVVIPLFDGGALIARTAQADKRIAEAVDLFDDRAEDIVLEVQRAWLAVREAAEKLPVARAAVLLAEENLRINRDQYAEGLLTSADVLLEEERLSRARSGYHRSLYDCRTAQAQLVNAAGGAIPPSDPVPPTALPWPFGPR